jgi:radical SAM superfamily enzyme YgiQ (UPF0313 family)
MFKITNKVKARLGEYDLALVAPPFAVMRYDAEGRWCSFRLREEFFRRRLDGTVVVHEENRFRTVSEKVRDRNNRYLPRLARHVADQVESGRVPVELHGTTASLPRLVERLRRAADWSAESYEEDIAKYRKAYDEPIPILPPDRYKDVVVNPATGCPNSRCTFCAFYRARPFHLLKASDFLVHLDQVLEYFGAELHSRGGIFLGSASALSIPRERLLEVLRVIDKRCGPMPRGVAAFLDPDHAPHRSADDYRALAALGLQHVTIGLETGDRSLRKSLGKNADLAPLRVAVEAQRAAGLRTALTILVAGEGDLASEQHFTETVKVIRSMDLGPRDLVFLSPLQSEGSASSPEARLPEFRTAIAKVTAARIAFYRIDRFGYYA